MIRRIVDRPTILARLAGVVGYDPITRLDCHRLRDSANRVVASGGQTLNVSVEGNSGRCSHWLEYSANIVAGIVLRIPVLRPMA